MASERPPSIEEEEIKVKKNTRTAHREEIGLVENLLNSYLAGFRQVGSFPITEDNRLEQAWFLLITRSFNSMRCAYEFMQRGYYSQALTMVRSSNEDWLICMTAERIKAPLIHFLVEGGCQNFKK